MPDFRLTNYRQYLVSIRKRFNYLFTFDDFFSSPQSASNFCILRHDVDRKPANALKMAELEKDMGVCSTYYFRAKRHVLKPGIIRSIAALGHEIGYHYESLSDQKGDAEKAIKDFQLNLDRLRSIVPVTTIAMHGAPLSRFNNRDLWGAPEWYWMLKDKFGIKGEVYLDIDYSDIAYITDTGRNWKMAKDNLRDHVGSNIQVDLDSQEALVKYLKNPHDKLVFQTHPERWSDSFAGYGTQLLADTLINQIKRIL